MSHEHTKLEEKQAKGLFGSPDFWLKLTYLKVSEFILSKDTYFCWKKTYFYVKLSGKKNLILLELILP